jgi:FKBP-type peptidyl-prolyl cis-trans isomerase
MLRNKELILLFLIYFTGACTDKYPGYSNAGNGIYMKMLEIGEDPTNVPSVNDFITVDIEYATIEDSVFFEGRRKFQLTPPIIEGSIDECFLKLSKGDKSSFVISAKQFYENTLGSTLPEYFSPDDKMIATIKLIDIQNAENYYNEKEAFLKWIKDFGQYEKEILTQYLNKTEININPLSSGLYYITIYEGTGKRVELGDTVIFHYEGKFLNGKFFDSSHQRKEPFAFVYGQEWQVIPGLEEGLGLMREGEKAIFILPSELAWGETGSSTGIIPPYSSLIFEVELIEVRPKNNSTNSILP